MKYKSSEESKKKKKERETKWNVTPAFVEFTKTKGKHDLDLHLPSLLILMYFPYKWKIRNPNSTQTGKKNRNVKEDLKGYFRQNRKSWCE